MALLQARHHGLAGDCAELVGEGTVIDQDDHGEDPLTDGSSVLKYETLMDEEDAAWKEEQLRKRNISGRSKTTNTLFTPTVAHERKMTVKMRRETSQAARTKRTRCPVEL